MPPRSSFDSSPVLSRKRTADLLRQLRDVSKQLRVLKVRLAELERRDPAAAVARRIADRRRLS
jgi:hypothetical protein